jgi:hypothetical protein
VSFLITTGEPEHEANWQVTCIDGAISLAAWPFTVKGKFQSGEIIPFADLPMGMTGSNCPKEGIK